MACQSGLFYRCNHDDQFLTTHFLHVLRSGTRVFIVTYLSVYLSAATPYTALTQQRGQGERAIQELAQASVSEQSEYE